MIAALSHALGGEEVTVSAIAATAILALPLCVALAGRIGSLWRLSVAVISSQFVYHWSFSSIGIGSSSTANPGQGGLASPPDPHAAHLEALRAFTPELVSTGALNIAMWLSHAIAAILTIALLYRGERAFLEVLRLVSQALPFSLPEAAAIPSRPRLPRPETDAQPRLRLIVGTGVSYRGPPAIVSFAH